MSNVLPFGRRHTAFVVTREQQIEAAARTIHAWINLNNHALWALEDRKTRDRYREIAAAALAAAERGSV